MPIYEYECRNCGHQLEHLQKVSEAPLKECPECKHQSLEKMISAPQFQLKGQGWYATDFKTKSTGKTASSTSEVTKSDTKKDAGSSESST